MIDSKTLKKLAATCRKAGITHFKSAEFEFTLSDELPTVISKKSTKKEVKVSQNESFESDSLSEDDLLFWSSNPGGIEVQ